MVNGGVVIDRNAAVVRSGKAHITLRLIDMRKNRIQGAITLTANPYIDINGAQAFNYVEHGGNLVFERDPVQGEMILKMLDCEHNRKFLASHFPCNFWEIMDKEVEAEIAEMYKDLEKHMVKKAKIQEEVKPPETLLSDAELEVQAARLQAEAARRKLKNDELVKDRTLKSKKDDAPEEDPVKKAPVEETQVKDTSAKEPASTKPKTLEKRPPFARSVRKKSEVVTPET